MSSASPELKLISFKTCPFVQRAVLLLEERGVPYGIEFIDLRNKPDWFLALSPRGKVPVLLVDGTPLFESQAICEYLDETTEGARLMPEDAIGRARDRAWFAFASEDVFMPMYFLAYTDDAQKHADNKARLEERLGRLEAELEGRQWLSGSGQRFGMADLAFAPAFTRIAEIETVSATRFALGPRVRAWMERTLARPAMSASIPSDYYELSLAGMKGSGSVLFAA